MKRAFEQTYATSDASMAVAGPTARFGLPQERFRMGSLVENGVFQGQSPVTAVMQPSRPPGQAVSIPAFDMQPGSFPGTMVRVSAKREIATGGTAGGGPRANLIDTIETPPSVVNQTLGFPSNNMVNYQRKIAKLFPDIARMMSENQFTFIRCSGLPDAARATVRRATNKRLEEVLTLPALNFLLANSAAYQHLDPVQLSMEWVPEGVIIFENDSKTQDKSHHVEIVNRVKGPVRAFNIWGNNLDTATPLFFIVKVVEVPDYYVIDPRGNPSYLTREKPVAGSRYALQFFPYASSNRPEPPREALEYRHPEDGSKRYGVAIPVGRVEHRTRDTNIGQVRLAHQRLSDMVSCNPFSIFVDVRPAIVY